MMEYLYIYIYQSIYRYDDDDDDDDDDYECGTYNYRNRTCGNPFLRLDYLMIRARNRLSLDHING
jgi:hypothetical protein